MNAIAIWEEVPLFDRIGFLSMRGDRACQGNEAYGDHHEKADHHTERIDEVRVLLAHN